VRAAKALEKFRANAEGEGDADEQIGVTIIKRALKSHCARSCRTQAKKARLSSSACARKRKRRLQRGHRV
jgi:hypothetical protein